MPVFEPASATDAVFASSYVLYSSCSYLNHTAKNILIGTAGAAGLFLASAATANADTAHKVAKNESLTFKPLYFTRVSPGIDSLKSFVTFT